jgi:hypothetical protein
MVDIKTTISVKETIPKTPHQEEMILATVQGKRVTALPEDLYVPPNALEILLDTFAGPLDFLLYLILEFPSLSFANLYYCVLRIYTTGQLNELEL